MSLKERFRRLLLVGAIGLGLLAGAPMRPDEIEELLHRMNQSKVTHMVHQENEGEDET